MSETENCTNKHDKFCFVCGDYLFNSKVRSISSDFFVKSYKEIFKIDPNNRNIEWSPSVCCMNCNRRLLDKQKTCKYSSPMLWNEPVNHPIDCYFCNTEVPFGMTKYRGASLVVYPNVNSVVKPVLAAGVRAQDTSDHEDDAENEFSTEPNDDIEMGNADEPTSEVYTEEISVLNPPTSTVSSGSEFLPPNTAKKIKILHLTQPILNDIVRDLDLPKDKAELLASRFQDIGVGESKLNLKFIKKSFLKIGCI